MGSEFESVFRLLWARESDSGMQLERVWMNGLVSELQSVWRSS